MKTTMNISPPKRIQDIEPYLQLDSQKFMISSKKDAYSFIKNTTWNLYYKKLKKKDKGKVIKYLCIVTGYSYPHMKKLVSNAIKGRLYYQPPRKNRTSFERKYTNKDIELLADFDEVSKDRNGNALRKHFKRMYYKYGDERFVRLKDISHGHIYNLRDTNLYKYHHKRFSHTSPVQNTIGKRIKPEPRNTPGYIRVDSVHGGDKDGEKGLYYVNFIDEVTQWETVVCVPSISQEDLKEVYKEVLEGFPYRILNFHSDNGSEFINEYLAKILKRMHIDQTKSRPRKHNDNALVESKNGWVIRKEFGYIFRPKQAAPLVQEYLQKYFNTYLNFHRPCAFATIKKDKRGREYRKYEAENYETPYDKLKLIDPKGKYLKSGITYEKLDKIALEKSDYDYLKDMRVAYRNMIRKINNLLSPVSVSS
jgi:transposase InsO family protein